MLAVLSLLVSAPQPTPGHPVRLATEFFENRFIVTPRALSGRRLRLFTDSAGGLVLAKETAQELGLPLSGEGEDQTAEFPVFQDNAFIPAALTNSLYLLPREQVDSIVPGADGILGQQWFAGRVWTFDYRGKRLLWRAPGDLPKHAPEHEAKLHFQTNVKGVRQSNFARIEATVDGEALSFLLDTGASDILTSEALQEIGDGRPANRATSFLTQSVYDRWRNKHPDWKVVAVKTKTGQAMIRVPKIEVGGYTVGPVWFSVQRDQAFHQYMAQWMDRPTEGALGGSAFKYLRMTVDWPNAVAVFERP